MLLAIITAGMLGSAHAGAAPAVSVAAKPTAVFARPAPAPAKPLAHGPPLALPQAPPVLCVRYNVDASLDSKQHPKADGDIHSQGAACQRNLKM